jgi:hypothetical protein
VTETTPVPVDHRLAFVPAAMPVTGQPAPAPFTPPPPPPPSPPEPGNEVVSAAVRNEGPSPHESSTESHG